MSSWIGRPGLSLGTLLASSILGVKSGIAVDEAELVAVEQDKMQGKTSKGRKIVIMNPVSLEIDEWIPSFR